jgi:hypothetical protein
MYSGFPRIGHLPGSHASVEDVLLNEEESRPFLREKVLVFEKLDGINVALRRTGPTRIGVGLKVEWSRGAGRHVARAIDVWVRQREERLLSAIGRREVLYGEWMWHTVTVDYDRLPALFLGFSWRDAEGRILPFSRARKKIEAAGVVPAAPRFEGVLGDVSTLRRLVGGSDYGDARMEGVIVERARGWPRWAKWVEHDYAHPTPGHLSGARNRLVGRAC